MNRLQKAALIYLIALFSFVWGLATVSYRVFPYSVIAPTVGQLQEMINNRKEQGGSLTDVIGLKPQETKNNYAYEGFIKLDPDFNDEGYLLLSRFVNEYNQVIIELFSIEQEKVLHTWVPDIREVLRQTPKHQQELNNFADHRAQHPLLLSNGDLIIKNSEGPMARIRPDGSVVWTLDEHFHHSLELDPDGWIVVPINLYPPHHQLQADIHPFRDDGIAWVDPATGKLIKTVSLMDLMLEAGHRDLVFGIGPWEPDRFHLNDIDPVFETNGNTLKGDLLLSIRNLSAVALYRPSENRLVWIKTGPWLSQHDITLLDDGRFSIFGNDVLRFVDRGQVFINPNGHMETYVLDMETGEVETPWSDMLSKHLIRSKTQGRLRVLANNDLFVEATDSFRLIRMSDKEIRWEYIPVSRPGVLGAIHWCRYLYPEEVDFSFLKP